VRPLGTIVLAVWLILVGLMDIANLSFQYDEVVKGILAVVAGVLLIIKR
jgi:hypothetical protein